MGTVSVGKTRIRIFEVVLVELSEDETHNRFHPDNSTSHISSPRDHLHAIHDAWMIRRMGHDSCYDEVLGVKHTHSGREREREREAGEKKRKWRFRDIVRRTLWDGSL